MTDIALAAVKRKGKIRWVVSSKGTKKTEEELAALLDALSAWPADGFPRLWWSGDYRVLELTCSRPTDVDVVVTCHSAAGADLMDVSVATHIRSKRKPRPLMRSEKEALVSVGFGAAAGSGAELLHQTVAGGHPDLAARILRGLDAAFGMDRGADLTYSMTQGSRLDQMPVFQDIRPYELVALLRAAGFDVKIPEAKASTVMEQPSMIVVAHDVPFSIQLVEPNDGGGYLTMRMETRFDRRVSAEAVNDLNRRLLVATAVAEEAGLLLKEDLCVSGGVSHAAVRDRVDEWVNSVNHVARFVSGG